MTFSAVLGTVVCAIAIPQFAMLPTLLLVMPLASLIKIA